MKFLIIDTYYPEFLNALYAKYPLATYPYATQWRILMDQCFGTANYYSLNLQKLGYEATEIVANCRPLQLQWAREHGLKVPTKLHRRTYRGVPVPWFDKDWFYPILLEQVKEYRPDVIHFQAPAQIDPRFLRTIRPYVRLITAQIASLFSSRVDFRGYDLVLSSLPHFVQKFQELGIKSKLFRLGFEHTLLQKVQKQKKIFPVVHIGGYGSIHRERNEILEYALSQGIPLKCWGYSVNNLHRESFIRQHYQGNAWGLDMYSIRLNSCIVLSKHISHVADQHANIMTLYEATGLGTLLIIDYRQDLHELFELGKEVVAYRSREECVDMLRYYLAHEDERKAIAHAGQQRTLHEHTYYHRMQEFVEIVKSLL